VSVLCATSLVGTVGKVFSARCLSLTRFFLGLSVYCDKKQTHQEKQDGENAFQWETSGVGVEKEREERAAYITHLI
jgi:hypothetical protein